MPNLVLVTKSPKPDSSSESEDEWSIDFTNWFLNYIIKVIIDNIQNFYDK